MYAIENGFWYSQRTISALVQRFLPAPMDHAWFSFENPSNCFLAERPEFGNLVNRVMLLASELNRARGFPDGNRTEGAGWLYRSSIEVRHGTNPNYRCMLTTLIPGAEIVQ